MGVGGHRSRFLFSCSLDARFFVLCVSFLCVFRFFYFACWGEGVDERRARCPAEWKDAKNQLKSDPKRLILSNLGARAL